MPFIKQSGVAALLCKSIGSLSFLAFVPAALAAIDSAPNVHPSIAEPGPDAVRVTADGLFGNYYPAAGGIASPAVLLIGGSEGGLGGTRSAQSLRSHGYSVLSLAYFGAPGLPSTLRLVPLDYFDRALHWLAAQPEVNESRIGIVGVSKGAEASLLVAVRNASIVAVVAGAPQSVAWIAPESCGVDETSSWMDHGIPVPALPCGQGVDVVDAFTAYQSGLKLLPKYPSARIPVERIQAEILLECGYDDSLGPSCAMAQQIQASVAPGRVEVLMYRHAGHASFGPPVARDSPGYSGLSVFGGTAEGNAFARQDGWPRILKFLDKNLKGPLPRR